MFGLFTKTLRRRLISLMVVASIVSVAVISFFAIRYSSDALYQHEEVNIKNDLAVLSEALVHEKLIIVKNDVELLINNSEMMSLTKSIHNNILKLNSESETDTAKKEYAENVSKLNVLMKKRIDMFGFRNIFVFCDHNKLVYDLNNPDKVGLQIASLSEGPLKNTLQDVFKNKLPAYSDLEISAFNNNKPTQYLAVPVLDEDKKFEFVFVAALNGDWLQDSIKSFSTVARQKGVEVHIVGIDGKIRVSQNRTAESTKELGKSIKSELIDKLIERKSWTGITIDEEGVEVVGATTHLETGELKGVDCNFEWGISMEVPAEYVFAPVYKLIKDIIIVAIILVILFALMAFFFANSISKPISSLAGYASKVASGDLRIDINLKPRKDEVGILTSAFGTMFENLKNQINQMASASTQLSSSMKEIATTITQLSSSVTETTAAVNEITSTIEEVRQISNLANKRAEDMSSKADGVRSVADEGKTSSERVSNGILGINKQVESIANTTIKLGDQTKNISEIIDSVTDIADQSNLLSVNASIEAAKAGEYGRGFSVVAREIKSLADKSKESTKQIKDILTEIQKSASGAIMATEKGTKTVAEGLELSKTSKTSIEKLEESINTAVETSTQILASSKEQLNGMNQLFETVGSIKLAMQQNSEGIKQLEVEAKNMSDLAMNLNEMTKKFKVK